MVCLAKALGGGIAVAAIGGTTTVMSAIADGRYEQVGTFNGNPLAMAATRATLTDVLTPQAYAHLEALAARLRASLEAVIAEHGFGWHVVTVGAKGCVTFRRDRVREFRDFLEIDARLGHLHWLDAAQWRCISPAMGEGGAMAVVGSARRGRCRPVRRELRPVRRRAVPAAALIGPVP